MTEWINNMELLWVSVRRLIFQILEGMHQAHWLAPITYLQMFVCMRGLHSLPQETSTSAFLIYNKHIFQNL